MKSDTRRTVIEIINEVRRLLGYNPVTTVDADKHALILLRLLNVVCKRISDVGDFQEMQRTTAVTAISLAAVYTIDTTEPMKRIYEISFSTDKQALYPIDLQTYNQYSRSGSYGRPRFFCLKGVDSRGNPNFQPYSIPASAQAGYTFSVEYFIEPRLYDTSSGDDEVVFRANTVIQGLYARALEDESGGISTKERTGAERDFMMMVNEDLNLFNADTGTDVQFVPRYRGR